MQGFSVNFQLFLQEIFGTQVFCLQKNNLQLSSHCFLNSTFIVCV